MHTTKAGRSGRAIICFPIYEETCQAYPKSNGVLFTGSKHVHVHVHVHVVVV